MKVSSNKGYSLVEIAVGVLILTIFLICSVALFNGCYNTYRMIQQRNLAVDLAVSNMESMLQANSDVLTGFFVEEVNEDTNEYKYLASSEFDTYVRNNFVTEFEERYARLNDIEVANVGELSDEEYEKYIYEDKEFLINSFIANSVSELTESELESDEVKNGNYGLLLPSVTESGNEALLYPGVGKPSALLGEMAVRKTVTRLPMTNDSAYGNKILKLKVEVLYTNKINLADLTAEDISTITLESIKIAD